MIYDEYWREKLAMEEAWEKAKQDKEAKRREELKFERMEKEKRKKMLLLKIQRDQNAAQREPISKMSISPFDPDPSNEYLVCFNKFGRSSHKRCTDH